MDYKVYAEFCALIAEHTGAQIATRHAPHASIAKYSRARGFPTVTAYLNHVRENLEEELPHLCDHGLIHMTGFGRNRKFWEALQRHFFTHVRPGEPLRILSLGCANGHELATVAVLAHQCTEAKNIEIDAWDISPQCIKDAANPVFQKRFMAKLPFLQARAWKSLEITPKGYCRLIPELAARIRARVGDVRSRTGVWWGQEPGAYDLVLCRHLLIYLEASVVQDTYKAIFEVLNKRKQSFLGIGPPDPAPPHTLFQGLAPTLYCVGNKT